MSNKNVNDSTVTEALLVDVKCLKTFTTALYGSGVEGQIILNMDKEKANKLVKEKLVKIIK
ncbi:MAG: hypothetical protein KTR20_12820 [Cellvibrionaceae bacterium]|nr:hypothetical protein [Cellvibrionaceae bacterium]